ncbi:hypothetical protein PVIIG_00349 [Plasmodium vivax India VII]|uniref:Uncharacterized protein n=2 Tax=Plasmodium vivax TaxID=5855 RepID=A0A0J9T8H8_PLAVI|nr:hypothetical protein PVIIG_00349 [Plasmodium vivax India VII]KMZ91800.1 hypothetical protein PVMG_00673 [Plasmodium vivax Mauritania I]
MHLRIKDVNRSSQKNYSSMTSEERLTLKKQIVQDALTFAYHFSYSNFSNYQYFSPMYASGTEELKNLENFVKEIKLDNSKKEEMLKLARQKIPLYYFPLSNMYSEGELKYFENCIVPYVNKQEEVKQMQKYLSNAYQNYVIYNNIYELWAEELDSLNKLILFDAYRNKVKVQKSGGDPVRAENQEKIHINKIEKIKRRIRMHIYKDGEVPNEPTQNSQECIIQAEGTKKANINFDDWL